MAGGLRYETGREMPTGMQELYSVKLVELMRFEETHGLVVEEKDTKREALLRTVSDLALKLRDKYPVVERLERKRIFEIEGVYEDGLAICEACDNWFHCALDMDEVMQLSEYLKEVAFLMKEVLK